MAHLSEYVDPAAFFVEQEADSSMPVTTGPGLSAALQEQIDRSLYVGRHKQLGHYALLRRPWLGSGPWSMPDVSRKPVLVWELTEKDDNGRTVAQELGDWVLRLVRAADLARQGYETPREFAQAKYTEQGEIIERAEQERQKLTDGQFDEMFDKIETRQKAKRTVRGWRPSK